MALDDRARRNSNLCIDTPALLQDVLSQTPQYAPVFRFAYEWLAEHAQLTEDVCIRLAVDLTRDRRCYNLTSTNDVAVLLPGEEGGDYRDIMLRTHAGPLRCINEGHPAYAPLHYPLLFPYSTSGWHSGLHIQASTEHGRERQRLSLTQVRYYAYQLQMHPTEFSTILRGGHLLQQYIIDMWAASEQSRLKFIRTHQDEL